MISFTQFLRPNGEQRPVTIDRPAAIEAKAQQIVDAGYRFECEELSTGAVSLTISDGEDDLAMELCANGPAVPVAVDKLVSEFEIPSAAERVS